MKLLSLVKMDILFQVRHGFYYAYALVSVFYIGVLLFLPESMVAKASIFIIFTDPSVLGFFFIGGLVLLERGQSIFGTLFASPVSIHQYIWSKVLSLTCLAVISSSVIFYVIHSDSFDFFPFLLAVIFCSILFTLLGIVLSVRVKSINVFLYVSPVFVILFYIPLLRLFTFYESKLFYLLPTEATLILLEGALSTIPIPIYIYTIATSLIWIAMVYGWAYVSMKDFITTKYIQ
ncbi:fluoroquinolone transport system permease protein [Oceanobacillus limi]|uniref:Fluoroquinolone transport system permease protein n=1 Tax=Oceanobacillus limi TaxID=930131 RepID=A0A1I0EQB8_9BACI|nr:hypothetical protein [Oceanobacillus limi]SET46811.1 fluoroquinolone transport system permease protein [Oceanobacillus limi]